MWAARFRRGFELLDAIADVAMQGEIRQRTRDSRSPVAAHGHKVFSQGDEDGIIAEILRRIGLERGVYCEYGVGDGLECNTLALAAQGWRGAWISGEALAFDQGQVDPAFFRYFQTWVLPENVVALYREAMAGFGGGEADVLSFDLDSRDLFFVGSLLEAGVRPALAIVEYNAKFAPPMKWSVSPDSAEPWRHSDYMGASLASFVDLFSRHGYRLVACNAASGANAFFIDEARFGDAFDDVPADMAALYERPFYLFPRHGHGCDPRTALRCFTIGAAIAGGSERPEWVR